MSFTTTLLTTTCSFILCWMPETAEATDGSATAAYTAESAQSSYAMLDRLLHLPKLRSVHQFSSHNKKGENKDANSPLYKLANGENVIFDSAGPGCVRSMWGTGLRDDGFFKFYFDGEAEARYRISLIDFYRGKHPHFPSPLVSYEKRGHWGAKPYAGNSFVPIPFAKSLIITTEGPPCFYHIIYERYPHGTSVTTFTGKEDHSGLRDAFERPGEPALPQGRLEEVEVAFKSIAPGQSVLLFERKDTPCIIRRFVIEAEGTEEFFQKNMLQMKWDDHPRLDVCAPVGMFFGSAVKGTDNNTLPVSVTRLGGGRVRLSSSFPMPFWNDAEIVLKNRSQYNMGPFKVKLFITSNSLDPDDSGYFTTLYRDGQTTYGRDWLLYENKGTGWFMGAVQSMRYEHYCEGDEHFYIDGAISPQIHGTGSEDYYLACFWPSTKFDSPFACSAEDIHVRGGGHWVGADGAYRFPNSYARFHLEAPIPFYRSIDARIQHGGMSNIRSDYRSLAFCYLRKRPTLYSTDYINVGNETSEKFHDYTATQSTLTGWVEANPEGNYLEVTEGDDGRKHTGGEVTFTVATNPDNDGVRLRRRLDQAFPCQTAEVFIDDQYAGTWRHGYHNEHLRWFDSDFDIHPNHTHGKFRLQVRLVIKLGQGEGPFTDFAYHVFCYDRRSDRD